MRTIVDKPGILFLGKQGENMALELGFREPKLWREEFGAGVAQLLVRPPGNCGPAYPVVLEEDGDLAVWRVTAADTARSGYGRCELRWSVEGLVVKSKTYITHVAEGLSGGCGCGTDNWGAYLEKILRAGAQTLEAASRAESAAVHGPVIRDGTWWCWDADAGGYKDTGVPVTGEGGGVSTDDIGHGLSLKDGKLTVDTTDDFKGDNTLPMTAAGVETVVGNIEILLETI